MGERNEKLGGTNMGSEEAVSADWNDTFDATIESFVSRPLLRAAEGASGIDGSNFNFKENTTSNVNKIDFSTFNEVKANQNATFSWESSYVDWQDYTFSTGVLPIRVSIFTTGDGTTDILDNFDDGTKPTFWTETSNGGEVTASESAGVYTIDKTSNIGSSTSADLTVVSGDLSGVNRSFIILYDTVVFGDQSAQGQARVRVGSDTDNTWDTIFNDTQTSASSSLSDSFRRRGIIKINIKNDVVDWENIGETQQRQEEGGTTISGPWEYFHDTGSIDLSGNTDVNVEFFGFAEDVSGAESDVTMNFYGIYEPLDSPSSTVNVQLSNDGGSTYDNVSDSGYIGFASSGSNLGLKIGGTTATGEAALISWGNFRRIN